MPLSVYSGVCETPFGTILGESFGVVARSNCRPEVISQRDHFLPASELQLPAKAGDLGVYAGMPWQCVEYARRWWMTLWGIRFGSIDAAGDLWLLPLAERLADAHVVPLSHFTNPNPVMPQWGDLLVYKKSEKQPVLPYGHVAVVVGVHISRGEIWLAEQNISNKTWENYGNYTRKIHIKLDHGVYRVTDKVLGNTLLGWTRPQWSSIAAATQAPQPR